MLRQVSSGYAIYGGYALWVGGALQMPSEGYFYETTGEVMVAPLISSDPYLAVSGLSGKVYVVTKWRYVGKNLVEAHKKFDVTRSFEDVAASLGYVKKEGSDG